jgi:hypothetical protein
MTVNAARVSISSANTIVSFLPILVLLGVLALILLRSKLWTNEKPVGENDPVVA